MVTVHGRRGDVYTISDDFRCSCPAGQNHHVCYHVARLAKQLWAAGSLAQCAVCGRWDRRTEGEHRHVADASQGDSRSVWTCYRCLGGAA